MADLLLQANFFHRSEKVKDKKGYLKVFSLSFFPLLCCSSFVSFSLLTSFPLFLFLFFSQISQNHVFEEKGYYTWIFAGNMMWSNIATGLVIAVVIGFTLLPIWPDVAKKILWYFSVTFLIGTLAFCLIRVVAFLVLWILGYDFWIFPRLFDESLSFQDSFKPIYSFEKGSSGQGYYRIGMIALLIGFTYWAYSQPTEFDGFIQAQKDFIDDLYSGKLIADVAFDPRDHLDRSKKVPSLEDLLKELEKDENSITEKATESEESNVAEQSNSEEAEEDTGGDFIYIEADSSTTESD